MKNRWARYCSWSSCFSLILAVSVFCSPTGLFAEEFDWRNVNGQNWLTSVKSQFGGTCWAYASCGALESKYMLTRDDITYEPDVSEQQLVWETNPDLGDSVDGGKTCNSLDYFTSHGVVLESECPTQGTDVGAPPYWPLASGWANRVFKSASNYNLFAQGTNLDYIKSCVKAYGPLTLRMEVDNDWYDPAPAPNRGNHAVVIVGFHDNVNGESAPGGGYWIIRNSWGAGWNGDGYGAVAYATRPTYETPSIWNS